MGLAVLLCATALAPLGGIAARAQSSGSFQGLGFVGGGGPYPASMAIGVNADGSVVVGWGINALSQSEAFRWTQATGIVGLGFIGGGGPFPYSAAAGVNADGSVVVGVSSNASNNPQYEAFRWTQATGMVGLGFLAGGEPFSASEAYGINADGSVVVGDSTNAANQREAFRWTQATGMTGLGFISGGGLSPYSYATGVNADGSVVVGISSIASIKTEGEAFRWTQATGMVGLGFVAGDNSSAAYGLNADGSVVVGFSYGPSRPEAFRWTQATGMVGLGFVAGDNSSAAYGVNAAGSVVVGVSTNALNQGEAFRWTQATGMRSLAGLLTAAGVNLGGWQLFRATAVSANGQFIVGQGIDPSGNGEAYVARYIDSTVAGMTTSSIAGMTTLSSVQNSIDQLETARRRLMVQEHGLTAELLGENDAIGLGTEIGVFAQAGSAEGGGVGRIAFGNGFTLFGGLAYQGDSLTDVSVSNAMIGALALRYVYGAPDLFRPFAEIGGWSAPQMDLFLTRAYANGAGVAYGKASTQGGLSYAYGRAGGVLNVSPTDEMALSAEIGGEWLHTGAYSELMSQTNPFEANVVGATNTLLVGKIRGQWTHAFSDSLDATVWGALANALSSSTDLTATIAGFGVLTPGKAARPEWAEYGARIGYMLTAQAVVDVFADGASGDSRIGTAVHVGADFRYIF